MRQSTGKERNKLQPLLS